VITHQFIKIYDCSKDLIAPVYFINIMEGTILCLEMKLETPDEVRFLVGSQGG